MITVLSFLNFLFVLFSSNSSLKYISLLINYSLRFIQILINNKINDIFIMVMLSPILLQIPSIFQFIAAFVMKFYFRFYLAS